MMSYNKVVLIVCILQLVFATSGTQDDKLSREPFDGDQSGTVDLPESSSYRQITYIEFPTHYDSMYRPIVFTSVDSTGLTGRYRTEIPPYNANSTGTFGFIVIVIRYDITDVGSEALTIQWESKVQQNDQSGTIYLSKSSSSSQTVHIDFPIQYDYVYSPSAFAWVDPTGLSGYYRTKNIVYWQNSYGTLGFDVTVERYDTTEAGCEALTIQWQSKIYKNGYKTSVGEWWVEGKAKSIDVDLDGYSQYPYAWVTAWTRGSALYPDTFATTVTTSSSGFTADIVRNDPNRDADTWGQDPTLYWSEKDISNLPGKRAKTAPRLLLQNYEPVPTLLQNPSICLSHELSGLPRPRFQPTGLAQERILWVGSSEKSLATWPNIDIWLKLEDQLRDVYWLLYNKVFISVNKSFVYLCNLPQQIQFTTKPRFR